MAKKEFADLTGNWIVVIIIAAYVLFIVITLADFNNVLEDIDTISFFGNLGLVAADRAFRILALYGSLLGIIVGCFSIFSEWHGNALNTLAAKPLYRDTIINGKFLGSISFILLIMGMAAAFFTSGLVILYGNAVSTSIYDYISRLTIGFGIAVVYVMIFLAFSALISLIVKNQAYAMTLGIIVLYVSEVASTTNVALPVSRILNDASLERTIMSLSPYYGLYTVEKTLFNSIYSIDIALDTVIPVLQLFAFYIIIAFVLSYVVFLRKDIV